MIYFHLSTQEAEVGWAQAAAGGTWAAELFWGHLLFHADFLCSLANLVIFREILFFSFFFYFKELIIYYL